MGLVTVEVPAVGRGAAVPGAQVVWGGVRVTPPHPGSCTACPGTWPCRCSRPTGGTPRPPSRRSPTDRSTSPGHSWRKVRDTPTPCLLAGAVRVGAALVVPEEWVAAYDAFPKVADAAGVLDALAPRHLLAVTGEGALARRDGSFARPILGLIYSFAGDGGGGSKDEQKHDVNQLIPEPACSTDRPTGSLAVSPLQTRSGFFFLSVLPPAAPPLGVQLHL